MLRKIIFRRNTKCTTVWPICTAIFLKEGLISKPKGLFGIIVANKWMRANYGEPFTQMV